MNRKANIAIKADFLHFLSESEMVYIRNGLLWVEDGKVKMIGSVDEVSPFLPKKFTLKDESGKLVFPGFIDGHVHAVQTQAIASYGKQLLDWLETYIFPLEQKFEDEHFARRSIKFFLNQLVKNGTTTAAIFPSRHSIATSILFEEALALNMRILAGKTNMDRNAPIALCDDTKQTYIDNQQLINKYHQKGRINYTITPRFAITSTEAQLQALGDLKKSYPQLAVQTHVSESRNEVDPVKKMFPQAKNYLDVYDTYGYLGKGSLMAHAIFLEDDEWKRLSETQTSIIHCPTSNLFLGSGLFNMQKCRDYNIPLALGSDVGAGNSFSMLRTASEAYKVAALQNIEFTARNAFYLLTLGGAKALNQDDFIGNFEIGKEADFVVVDIGATELMQERITNINNIDELLFVLMMLGDDRNIKSVYLQGEKVNI
ncbi:MAG: guanine deaminase [Bacteroidales bacterium]|jgi:guanine deaminase|nr:guanine deaminase [Bacteroidales bacterium]